MRRAAEPRHQRHRLQGGPPGRRRPVHPREHLSRAGRPARHLHSEQDEWFYALEGEFLLEVGAERFRLHPGDAVLAPRRVPHVWASVGPGRGRILVAFTPPGSMEAFFRAVTKANAMPPQDPALWRAHGMELLGPPLALE
ncbi:MAG TPA: cupin domain-containing protein [Thermomicrobiales bacterium]|nr:cupin domain-containing protein [Thermomicrobiales bacterium]